MVMAQVMPPLLVSTALVVAFSIPLFLALVVLEMASIGRMRTGGRLPMDNSVSIMAHGSDTNCGCHRQPGWKNHGIPAAPVEGCGFPMFGKNAMAYDGDSIWDLWIDIGGEG
jgi:hypothetical protein